MKELTAYNKVRGFINEKFLIEFPYTYFKINYHQVSGKIRDLKDMEMFEYGISNCKEYDESRLFDIIDLTGVDLSAIKEYKFQFSRLVNDYAIISNETLNADFCFSDKLTALNLILEKNRKKLHNGEAKKYDAFPAIKKIKLDEDISQIKLNFSISKDSSIGLTQLIGIYPYKGRVEANFIINSTDYFIEDTRVQHLIFDVKNFSLERDWDNDLSDLFPTHPRYYKEKKVNVYYLVTEVNSGVFKESHEQFIYYNMEDIYTKIGNAKF